MRIGFDIDDTISKTFEAILPAIKHKYRKHIPEIDTQKVDIPYHEYIANKGFDYYAFARKNYSKLLTNAKVQEDATKYINKLKEEGNEIFIITARSRKIFDFPHRESETFLKKNNIPFDKIVVAAKDKGKVCKKLKIDLFVDDNLKNCYDIKKRHIDVLLFDSPLNIKNQEFIRVYNFKNIYDYIKKVENGKNSI